MQSPMQTRNTVSEEVRDTIPSDRLVGNDRDAIFDDAERYRAAIRSGRRWDALRLFREDRGKKAYQQLTEKEQVEVDLLVDMAIESL